MLPESLKPYAKAMAPLLAAAFAAGLQWFITGEFDKAELVTALTGLGSSGLAFSVSNKPEPAHRVNARSDKRHQ